MSVSKKKEKLKSEKETLRRKREREEISSLQFETSIEKLDREIFETSHKIQDLKIRLDEVKGAKK